MGSISYRADLLKISEVEKEFVNSDIDASVIKKLCNNSPILLEGSRGTGKTMLLKKAEAILVSEFSKVKKLPVYISFNKTTLVKREYFETWMLSKLIYGIKASLKENLDLFDQNNRDLFDDLFGSGSKTSMSPYMQKIDDYIEILERTAYDNDEMNIESYKNKLGLDFDTLNVLRHVDVFKDFVKRICIEFSIDRAFFLIDEACHNFLQEEQRKFFTLFRDLTCDCIVCNAAVYPGITSYGESFQLSHDAELVQLNRKIDEENYVEFMRQMVKKKIENSEFKKLENQGELFDTLIYAASGNPRILLKSLSIVTQDFAKKLNKSSLNEFIKDFYLTDIWNEHSELLDKYVGHVDLINWGREYIENYVISGVENRNEGKETQSIYFAIDRDNSKAVQHAVRILEYSGIVTKDKENLKKQMNGKNRLFLRYQLNLGIVAAKRKVPTDECRRIVSVLSTENCFWQTSYPEITFDINEIQTSQAEERSYLNHILKQNLEKLDMSSFLKGKAKEVGCETIGDILINERSHFKKAYYVGDYRARKIYDEAMSAVLEYISG